MQRPSACGLVCARFVYARGVARSWALSFCLALCAWACDERPAPLLAERSSPSEPAGGEPVTRLPAAPKDPTALVELGRALFFDPIVSGDGQVSCASCHRPERAFADGAARAERAGRPPSAFNTPSLVNVVFADRLNWDGRHVDLGEHLDALLESPEIMAGSWSLLEQRLAATTGWTERFERALGEAPRAERARQALLAYERSLVSAPSAFDRWLAGEAEALPAAAAQGYALFKSHGCASCHQGALLGANLLQPLGVAEPYPPAVADAAPGFAEPAPQDAPPRLFRVPGLRNVALTAPYLHDGSLATLDETVRVMARYQLGRELEGEQVSALVRFLEALSSTPSSEGSP